MEGLAANGFGDAFPGKFDMVSGFVTEVVMTFFFLIIILGATSMRAPPGFAPIAIGLGLTLIHLISIPVTNTSVNPARSTGPAFVLGGILGGLLHRWLSTEQAVDAIDRAVASAEALTAEPEALAPMPARQPR